MTTTDHIDLLCKRFPALIPLRPSITRTAELLISSFRNGGKLLLAGNGGSAADCLHIAGELLKGFTSKRPLSTSERDELASLYGDDGRRLAERLQGGLPAIALPGEISLTSAMANDVDPDLVYAQGVMAFGKPGDVLLALSTSGAARNVIAVARVARWRGLHTIALTGKDGGPLASLCDIAIIAPGVATAEIQEYHLPIYHTLCAAVEEAIFGN
ncbi:MAG: D-sedoheptulose-7-phosphate isomerase [Armatimonadota bacterium]